MAPGTAKVLSYSLEFLAAVAAYILTHGGITRDVYIEHVADTAHSLTSLHSFKHILAYTALRTYPVIREA